MDHVSDGAGSQTRTVNLSDGGELQAGAHAMPRPVATCEQSADDRAGGALRTGAPRSDHRICAYDPLSNVALFLTKRHGRRTAGYPREKWKWSITSGQVADVTKTRSPRRRGPRIPSLPPRERGTLTHTSPVGRGRSSSGASSGTRSTAPEAEAMRFAEGLRAKDRALAEEVERSLKK